MPIIEPIPMDELPPVSRTAIQDGCDEGLYATPIPLQIFAYNTRKLLDMDDTRRIRGGGSLLGGRILELLRIRSAQLGECQPCMQSRKHDSITAEDVACMLETEGGRTVSIGGQTAVSTFMVMPPDVGGGLQLQQAITRYTWDGETANGMLERSSPPAGID